ncbi:MICOS complex subunit MIC26-like [Antennarius striatus]|uniref:MICOS complex subunit MIC26-like n=1 Tax=Antennarius striatus TaxID=241820 RepID=UPI0035AE0356
MLKVTCSVMPGVLSFLPITVYAVREKGKEDAVPLHRDDLSLYTGPPQPEPGVEPEAGRLEQSVASLRKLVKPYTDSCQVTFNQIKPQIQGIVQVGNDTYTFLKNPPKDFYPRAGVIGFTGLLGLFLARGSRIKRLVYPAGLVTLSTSLYYPKQAVTIAKSTGECAYESAVQAYAALEKMIKPAHKTDEGSKSDTKP